MVVGRDIDNKFFIFRLSSFRTRQLRSSPMALLHAGATCSVGVPSRPSLARLSALDPVPSSWFIEFRFLGSEARPPLRGTGTPSHQLAVVEQPTRPKDPKPDDGNRISKLITAVYKVNRQDKTRQDKDGAKDGACLRSRSNHPAPCTFPLFISPFAFGTCEGPLSSAVDEARVLREAA